MLNPRLYKRDADQEAPEEVALGQLQDGPLYRFSDCANLGDTVPRNGAGVYTIWDDEGTLVYAGIAGRNPAGKGLSGRLRSHASGRRSGDQFCVYVADHYVLPELTRDQVEASRDSRLSMDSLVRHKIHADLAFRVQTPVQTPQHGRCSLAGAFHSCQAHVDPYG